ncbi:hypothetical protein NXW76_04370 [Bacteroides thetaiotaomicron]|nr:hypothetical protein [Bacteroides thetaiotaomicron]
MVTELYGQGYKEYYTGMANGFDMAGCGSGLTGQGGIRGYHARSGSAISETAFMV